jgi:hypothetical protein
MVLRRNLVGGCPGGWCDYLVQFSEVLVVLLLVDAFIFLVTLIPPLFSWKTKKPDSRRRIFFAAFACLTFYFWLIILAIHSLYCFGFLAHAGPCNSSSSTTSPTSSPAGGALLAPVDPLQGQPTLLPGVAKLNATGVAVASEQCVTITETSLKNITLVNFLIILILIIVVAANINEALHAKALYYQETLCRKEDIQKFLSTLVTKKPEVGHLVKCFHVSKSADAKTNSGHKVVTYSTVDNFEYQTWKDFSDLRLIDPSRKYPVIEVEIVLNFFPGDHSTADKYKRFVQKLTKEHTGKDAKISIDDYFHIEDQKEWTFYIGSRKYIVPWWEKDPARIFLSCVLLFGWPFRLSYGGRVAKHRIEVKKAVFCESTSQDEGVSLTATPGSSMDGASRTGQQEVEKRAETPVAPVAATPQSTRKDETVVDVQVGTPPPPPTNPSIEKQYQQQQQHGGYPQQQHGGGGHVGPAAPVSPDRSTPLLRQAGLSAREVSQGVMPPMPPIGHGRAAPMASPRTHLRETTKDIVTAVTHHDINGLNAVSTVALKDIDVQMSALSGYETYV